jgi:hypothetical protein
MQRTGLAQSEDASSEAGFFAQLEASGVLVRKRYSQRDPRQVTGYAVAQPGYVNRDGSPGWYGGGRLAVDLAISKLRARWLNAGTDARARSRRGVQLTGAERRPGPLARSERVPLAIRQRRPTQPGRRPTPCRSPQACSAAGHFGMRPTVSVALPVTVTGAFLSRVWPGVGCASLPDCSLSRRHHTGPTRRRRRCWSHIWPGLPSPWPSCETPRGTQPRPQRRVRLLDVSTRWLMPFRPRDGRPQDGVQGARGAKRVLPRTWPGSTCLGALSRRRGPQAVLERRAA